MDEIDQRMLRAAIQRSHLSREHGNHPFGAVLVDRGGNLLLEGENTVVTERDCTGHAETNLMRLASQRLGADILARCTVYTSTEPCPMCAGAIFWGNVRRVVFGLGLDRLYELIGDHPNNPSLRLHCREVFARAAWPIEVLGPTLEEEALAAHAGFWHAAR